MMPPEKRWSESKKFLAYLLANLLWALLMGMCVMFIENGARGTILVVMSCCLAFLQVIYIGGQAAVDAFVRFASVFASVAGGKFPTPKPSPQGDDTP